MINILSNLLNAFNRKTESKIIDNNKPKKILIYDKTIPVISTNTEGRQELIKELIKNHIQLLFDGKDCSEFNWISPKKYNLYKLSEPEEIKIPCNNNIITIYNEGKFILK